MDGVLYYGCANYYFEIEQADGDKQYGKSKENRPNPIIQMGLFTDGKGIPLAFSLFNHMGKRAFIVTQSIKKLPKEGREWALDPKGFKRLADDKPVDRNQPDEEDAGLCTDGEPDYSPLSDLLSGAFSLPAFGRETGRGLYL